MIFGVDLLMSSTVKTSSPNNPLVHQTANIINSKLDITTDVGAFSCIRNSSLSGHVKVGDHSAVVESFILGKVQIGRYTSFNGPNSDIVAKIHGVTIGNFCSIARSCTIQEFNHKTDRCTSYYIVRNLIEAADRQECFWNGSEDNDIESRGPIAIGNDVWIGAQTVILSGVTIGSGAVIAANSTVTHDIPPYAIAGGTPAKVIRYRFDPELITALLQLEWWLWDDEQIRRNRELFEGTMTIDKIHAVKT
jgi:virginiamycin A acetyltransferase